ncbi:class I SAM-dependent methyltransferase [Prochlorococcus marinus]|uniref:class I SAM-dependent methyltransferase n=1 Tax=Prochlorococcus marinus TaxID=1219 RepID=UPI0022B34B2F|nr:class I SAM-dependent methyltransferase [Prochlorococcus marinus]
MVPSEKEHKSIDPIWEEKYSSNLDINRYPWDSIVSWIFRNVDKTKLKELNILEVGCGTANNLWFAAREGFNVYGIDGSESAINYAKKRFSAEDLQGELIVGDITILPFKTNFFDLVIDRAAITCLSEDNAKKCFSEIHRVSKLNGKFFFNPYSDHNSSMSSGIRTNNDLVDDIKSGSVFGAGKIRFYSKKDILSHFEQGWLIEKLHHCVVTDMKSQLSDIQAEWRVSLKKIS